MWGRVRPTPSQRKSSHYRDFFLLRKTFIKLTLERIALSMEVG